MAEEEEDSAGLGMAEIIAIVVCGLIIFAFIFACYIVIRNAKKRKRTTSQKGLNDMSFDKIPE